MSRATPIIQTYRLPERATEGQLLDMLSYQRRSGSTGEDEFLQRYLDPLGFKVDGYGNYRVEVDPLNTTTLFSCHVDSVHPSTGHRQTVMVDDYLRQAFKSDKYALGADDAVGVWLMLHMVSLGVPGVYVFHRDEEVGGRGSSWVAENDEPFLKRFARAIAFDRRGTTSVITHQSLGRCCSDDFAWSLAAMLGGGYRTDDGGTFTDTANYMDVISECTNISVGYANEHGGNETLDLEHALWLRDALPAVEWEKLPERRDPETAAAERAAEWARWSSKYYTPSRYKPTTPSATPHSAKARTEWDDDEGLDNDELAYWEDRAAERAAAANDWTPPLPITFDSEEDAYEYLLDHPEEAAALLWAAYSSK